MEKAMEQQLKSVNINSLPLGSLGLPTVWFGEVPLFNLKDSLKFIDYCEHENISLLGMEGFYITNNYRMPDMNWIADFSSIYKETAKSFESARRILNYKGGPPSNLFFEFTLY